MSWKIWKKNGDYRPKSWLDQLIKLEGWDAHLIWADMTHFAMLKLPASTKIEQFNSVEKIVDFSVERKKLPSGVNPSGSPISVIFEADSSQLAAIKESKKLRLKRGSSYAAPFYTGIVGLEDLDWLQANVTRLRVGITAAPKSRSFSKGIEDQIPTPVTFDSNDVVLGIIDHGIAFANRDFAQPTVAGWLSRIEHFWDQAHGYPASPNHGLMRTASSKIFGYGWEIDSAVINGVLNFEINDSDIYSAKNKNLDSGWFNYPAAQKLHAHGTHVLSLLGGKNYADDAASNMPIIAVQLPALPYKDTSGQNLCVHVLNAVEYILEKAGGRKVVINISDGANAGPHDGTSLLESALDTIVKNSNGRVKIVAAAGNQFNDQIHWQDSVSQTKPAEIFWRVLPDDKTDSHLEIWFDKATTQEQLNAIEVQIESPSGKYRSDPIKLGQFAWLTLLSSGSHNPADLPSAAAFFCVNPPNAVGRTVFHLALSATRSKYPGIQADSPHGLWKIHLTSSSEVSTGFNAYIERDDPAMGDNGPRRQSFFVHPEYPRDGSHGCGVNIIDSDQANASPIKRLGTLNNIATAGNVVAVGGYVKKSRVLAPYSTAGPGRSGASQNVDYLAPSEQSNLNRGITGCGVRSGTYFRMGGTSVASPQVARAIANSLASNQPWVQQVGVTGISERIGLSEGV